MLEEGLPKAPLGAAHNLSLFPGKLKPGMGYKTGRDYSWC